MTTDKDKSLSFAAELYRRAEEQLPPKASEAGLSRAAGNMQQLCHELEVHQIELELQNVELCDARDEEEKCLALLKASEEQFRSIVENSPNMIMIHVDGAFVYLNPEAVRNFGIKNQQALVGKPIFDVVHPDFRDVVSERISIITNQNQVSLKAEEQLLRADGSTFWVEISGSPATFEGKKAVQVIAVDITERKRVQKLLRQSEQLYQTVVEDLTEIICRFLADGTFIFVNEIYCCFFGKTRNELLGSKWRPAAFPDDVPHIEEQLRLLSPSNPIVSIESRVYTSSGAIRWMHFINRGYFDTEGRLLEIQSVGRDITEQKIAENKLRESQELLQAVINGAEDSIFLKDHDSRYVLLNPATEHVLGKGAEEVVGRELTEIHTDPEIAAAILKNDQYILKSGQAKVFEETVRFGFGYRTFLSSKTPRRDESGRVIGLICVAHEITERKQAEEKQKNTVELLRLCNEAVSTLEFIWSITIFFQDITGCEAIGVRLRDGDDFPFYEARGFPDDIMFSKKHLCDWDLPGGTVGGSSGNPALDCMCGTILQGRYDPSDPFFTTHGSFWSSSTTELPARTTDTDLSAKTRNRCTRLGYESVALIPIRFQDEIIGLFQFNDKRKGCFTVEKIAWLEELVDFVAIALAKLRSDESLRVSESKFRSYIDSSPDGVFIVDEDGRYLEVNRAVSHITGYSEVETLATSITDQLSPESVQQALRHFKTLKEIGSASGEFEFLCKDGAYRWLLVNAVKLSETRYLGFTKDITNRKQSENDLRNYARRLIEMEEELRKKLAAELHDEIGRDLTAIGMNLSVISDSMTDETPSNLVLVVKDSRSLIKGINHTVRDIMTDLRPPVLDDFGLLAALRWHADLFVKRTGIAVFIEADDPFPRFSVGKELALFRIAQEALINVAKHADTQTVTINLKRFDGMIRFAVIDEGNGCIPASCAHIQAEPCWGMKIMRERAELMGGNFHVDSAPGKGTVVSVNLPLEDM